MKTYLEKQLLLMQEKPFVSFNTVYYNMFSYHHYQVDTKSDPIAIEGQDWQIAQNIPPSWTLSQQNSFSHFAFRTSREALLMKPRGFH